MATRMKKTNEEVNEFEMASEDVAEEEVVTTPTRKTEKKTFVRSEYVMCRSVTAGGLNVTGRSGNYYEFKRYGAECEIEYNDLVALVRKGSSYVFFPRFIIEDENFLIEFPQVAKLYDGMYTKADLSEVLNLPVQRMVEEINKLPIGAKTTLKSLVATNIAKGKIDSVKKIRALSEVFNSDFNLLSELFNR